MKKNYISPEAIVASVALPQMIAASQFTEDVDSQNITMSDEETDEFTSRRRRGVWDDEEEEEH